MGPRLTFAEPQDYPLPATATATPLLRSRRSSPTRGGGGGRDAHINISDMLESYRLGAGAGEEGRGDDSSSSSGGGSSYSTQDLPLSFNDLPIRAQHLILNELMRQHSGGETAVLLTTLPIPEEGTCRAEEDSLRYLSDIEVLCHELPPVLLVLSNNMTVTVSL